MTPSEWKLVLKKIAPKADPRFVENFADSANDRFSHWGVTDRKVIGEFLGQCAHETMGLTAFTENMSYSAKRLTQVWPSRFPTIASAAPYANNPRALANKVYANRMGNGSQATGDGYENRGGGLCHHTGRGEYDRVLTRTGHRPDAIRNPARADAMLDGGLTYFIDRGVVPDMIAGRTDTVTRKLNGGMIGAQDRRIAVARAHAALNTGMPMPKARTTVERRDRAQAAAKATGAAGATSAVAPVAAPTLAPDAPASHGALIAGGLVLACALAIGAYLFIRHRNKLQADLDADARQRHEQLEIAGA
jgi:putative chitinase